jgi:hypothetical protein
MTMKSIILIALTSLLVVLPTVAADGHPELPPAPTDPRFEFLRGLEGLWVGEEPHGEMGPSTVEFRVTAGGHAIEEREFAGTPMEMLTVYRMEGKELRATHYCVLGNQPGAVADRRVKDGALKFDCDGKPGNTKSHDDMHVHGWVLRLDDEGKLHSSAEIVAAGEIAEKPSFVLTRQAKVANR